MSSSTKAVLTKLVFLFLTIPYSQPSLQIKTDLQYFSSYILT